MTIYKITTEKKENVFFAKTNKKKNDIFVNAESINKAIEKIDQNDKEVISVIKSDSKFLG